MLFQFGKPSLAPFCPFVTHNFAHVSRAPPPPAPPPPHPTPQFSDQAEAASAALVTEATKRWKENEGNYRDDITAVVVFLPLLHPEWNVDPEKAMLLSPLKEESSKAKPALSDEAEGGGSDEGPRAQLLINEGVPGLLPLGHGEHSPMAMRTQRRAFGEAENQQGDAKAESATLSSPLSTEEGGGSEGDEGSLSVEELEERKTAFLRRRLSMDRPFDDKDWSTLSQEMKQRRDPRGDKGEVTELAASLD